MTLFVSLNSYALEAVHEYYNIHLGMKNITKLMNGLLLYDGKDNIIIRILFLGYYILNVDCKIDLKFDVVNIMYVCIKSMLPPWLACWTIRNKSLKNADRHFNCIACELPKYLGIATCITLNCF